MAGGKRKERGKTGQNLHRKFLAFLPKNGFFWLKKFEKVPQAIFQIIELVAACTVGFCVGRVFSTLFLSLALKSLSFFVLV
jgi:hypothetical protein